MTLEGRSERLGAEADLLGLTLGSGGGVTEASFAEDVKRAAAELAHFQEHREAPTRLQAEFAPRECG